jgi:hypothetical protein
MFDMKVNAKLRLPAVLNKFLQPIALTPEEFFPQWKGLAGPPLKLQEVVCNLQRYDCSNIHIL